MEVPYWDRMLEIAAKSYEITGLGYLGVDLVLDKELGPLMLELNARPGLNIQIANRCGMSGRLEAVDKLEGLAELTMDGKIAAGRRIASS
jgi:glutathione synthase/RimK-type ligase-like ATP-grasp enzyme